MSWPRADSFPVQVSLAAGFQPGKILGGFAGKPPGEGTEEAKADRASGPVAVLSNFLGWWKSQRSAAPGIFDCPTSHPTSESC